MGVTYYYELHPDAVTIFGKPVPKYVSLYGESSWAETSFNSVHEVLASRSIKVWEERTDGKVMFIKLTSPYLSDMGKVDMKEFMWMKLQAENIY